VRLSHLPHVKIGHPVLVEGTSPQLFEVVPLVAIADIASEHPDSPRRLAVVKIAADKGNQALLRARSAATRVSGRFHSYSPTNRAIALTRRTAGDQLLRPLAMPIVSIPLALRRATSSPVHPADAIASHRRRHPGLRLTSVCRLLAPSSTR